MEGTKSFMWSHQTLDPVFISVDSLSSASTAVALTALPSSSSDLNIESKFDQSSRTDQTLRHSVKDLESCISDDSSISALRRFSWIRYAALSVYRQLFSLVFVGNGIAFVFIMATDRSLLAIVNAAVANLLALGLARHPLVVNALFVMFGSIPRSSPFWLRKTCAKIYCYGGIHSGCGVASLIWYLGFIGVLTQQYTRPATYNTLHITPAIMTLSYLILILLFFIIVAAYPTIRMKMHDYFELTHRFCGWTVVALFWPLLVLFSIEAARLNHQSLGRFLITFPTFWMVILTTLSILYPWILLRRVPVRAETISTHATRLHFNHTTINFGQGIGLAKNPLKDWHSFATFPDTPSLSGTSGTTKANPDFSCLISKAGDWTSDTINNPPNHLWKRAVPIYGFGYVMRVFTRMILVTTGSGIGPCLSYLGDPNRPAMRVVWQTRTPLKTYGQPVIDMVEQLDPNPHIIDTSIAGKRVDMLPLVLKTFRDFNAEAVCVISNPVMTQKLVFDCEARGVPAFGPIFDS